MRILQLEWRKCSHWEIIFSFLYNILDRTANEVATWTPVRMVSNPDAFKATAISSNNFGKKQYICRASVGGQYFSGAYLNMNNAWACYVGTPSGPKKVVYPSPMDLLVLSPKK
jgi:hypothetical protein